MAAILSTKILTSAQRNLLLNSGLAFVEYNSIDIELVDFNFNSTKTSAIIFTSKNAVLSFLKKDPKPKDFISKKIFCVGEKTGEALISEGFLITNVKNSAKELAEFLVINFPEISFIYFCGNIRRDELMNILSKNHITCEEIVVYKTRLNPKIFTRNFDGILFFSPSAVKSFVATNAITSEVLFCIGETTASEAKKYSQAVFVARKPSIENVIVQVVKEFKENYKPKRC